MSKEFAKLLEGGFTPSKYQVAIFQHIKDFFAGTTSENALVDATAGSSKTTTIVAAAKLIPATSRAAFVAFGKKIADELSKKLPRTVEAMTLNSLGNRIWSQYVSGKGKGWPKVDDNKISKIIRNTLTKGQNEAYGAEVSFLVKMAKAHGVVPQGYRNAVCANGLSDTYDFWAGLVEFYQRDIKLSDLNTIIEHVRVVLAKNLDDETTIDFADQLYMPVVKRTDFGTRVPHKMFYDALFVDEAQDLNPVQLALIEMVLKPKALLIAVGDPDQAIYGFRGAGTDSMEKIKARFSCKTLKLSISYRCAKAIVNHAQEVCSKIEASPVAKAGTVSTLDKFTPATFKPEDLILCRNNAPLISFAYRLIKARVRCKVLGRDIGKDLISLINRIEHENSVSLLVEKMNDWLAQQISVIRAKDEDDDAGVQRVQDRYDSIMVFAGDTTAKTVDALITEIEAMFLEEKNADETRKGFVLLSTIHKAKGLESDRVFALDDHLLYPRWVKPGTWEYEQERHVDFVKRTRAKNELHYIQGDKLAA